MARKGGKELRDPIGGGGSVYKMPSGLVHCADSLGGGREGTFVQRFGAPGDPLEKSRGSESTLYGRVPNIADKFLRKGQR
jgi:hypothetical protein